MELRIGIADRSQLITVTLAADADRDAIKVSVNYALEGTTPVLWLTDDQGREIAVSSASITHVEIGPVGSHPIGFG